MKNFVLTIALLLSAFTIKTASAQYSNATLNGAWFMCTSPLSPYNDSLTYMVFDGVGNFVDFGAFTTTLGGTYSVSTAGVISGNLIADGTSYPCTGQLTSQNAANLTMAGGNRILSRITNTAALADTLTGTLTTQNCGQATVKIAVNSQGIITYASGLTAPVTGRIYAQSGVFQGHLKTGATNNWDQLSIMGYYSGNVLTGQAGLDANNCGTSTSNLVRSNAILGIAENYFNKNEFSIYPNPSEGIFNIDVRNLKISSLKVLNILGEKVSEILVVNSKLTIDLSTQGKGIYFVQITDEKKNVINKKIVVE